MVAFRWRTRLGGRKAAKGATPPCLLEVCTDERHHGSGRSAPPYRPTGTDDCQAEATCDALRSQTTSVARDTEFFSLYEEELGGTQPDRLFEVKPQERRRTVVQIVDNTLIVPSLDVLVPQMESELVEVCGQLVIHIPEQAIEVPKTSSSSRHSRRRRVRFAEQTSEQLVEVPTIVSYSSLLGLVEQNVDIPVPHGRGGRVGVRGLQSFPGQDSTAFVGAARVDIPVPRSGALQGSRPRQASSVADEAFTGFFALFHKRKKVRS